ncbi:MAG: sulfur carrier protein ThiS [Clostridia bacterium]|nr:sulfur carrier protein ThiS [Clostridia bacterium]
MVKINGRDEDATGVTVGQYLDEEGFSFSRVAVEVNGKIVCRADYGKTLMKDGDEVEIVSFVGGG